MATRGLAQSHDDGNDRAATAALLPHGRGSGGEARRESASFTALAVAADDTRQQSRGVGPEGNSPYAQAGSEDSAADTLGAC
jgi:hypothetical protein